MRTAPQPPRSALGRAYLILLAFAAATLFDDRAWLIISRLSGEPMSAERVIALLRDGEAPARSPVVTDTPTATATVPPPPSERPEPIDPFLTRPDGSLSPFFDALDALAKGQRSKVRLLFFGTSEIGHDQVTSQIRRNLQERYGDGGKGFVLIDRTWNILDHRDIDWSFDDYGWQGDAIRGEEREDGLYGLGGILHDQLKETEVTWKTVGPDYGIEEGFNPFPSGSAWSNAEVHYQTHPGGGSFELYLDGELLERVETAGEEVADAKVRYEFEDGPHELRLVADNDNVRLYGAIFERERGVVLDALMVIGAWADNLNAFEPEHLERQVAMREPSLLVFQYGAKEVLRSPEQTEEQIAEFERDFASGIARVRAGAPEAGCLVLSPKDQAIMNAGRIETPSGLPMIVEAAARVAARSGCAFYDLYHALGGAGTIRRWYHRSPSFVMGDYKHLTLEGSVRVGDHLTELLFEELDLYDEYRSRDAGPSTAGPAKLAGARVAQREAFWAKLETDPVEKIEPCTEAALEAIDCRDPNTYVRTNERGHPLWGPQLEGLGGAYVGVDSSQNYSFISKAESEWAWIVEDDPVLLRLHHVIHAVVDAEESARDFVAAFRSQNSELTAERVRSHCERRALGDCDTLVKTFEELRNDLGLSFRRALRERPLFPDWGWLHADGEYEYVRELVSRGRIRVVPGSLNGEDSLLAIAKTARAMEVPVRVVYLSNHENYWSVLPVEAKRNLRALPFDEHTLVLRTLGKRWNSKRGFSRWHYNAHAGLDYQARLKDDSFELPRNLMPERKMLTSYSSVLGLDQEQLAVALEKGQANL